MSVAALRRCWCYRTAAGAATCGRRRVVMAAGACGMSPHMEPDRGHPGRVEHILAEREDLVSVLVAEALELPQEAVRELIRFGAIHTCPVPPLNPTLAPDLLALAQQARAAARAALAAPRRDTRDERPRRVTADAVVPRSSYLRVHVLPRRFPAAAAADWAGRVLADAEEYCVVDKPAGVPVVPTVDNLVECVLACAADAVGHPRALACTTRLDVCTEGVVVLAKSAEFAGYFNALIQGRPVGQAAAAAAGGEEDTGPGGAAEAAGAAAAAAAAAGEGAAAAAAGGGGAGAGGQGGGRAIRKFYRALTAQPPPLGVMEHALVVGLRRQGLPHFTLAHDAPVPGSAPAQLVVLGVEAVALTGAAAERWGGVAHECHLELITGRTHQIRAQLSAAGHPLLGDSLYGPLASRELRERLQSGDPSLGPRDAQGRRLFQEPEGGIGLQACRLEVWDDRMTGTSPAEFRAGVPWWRA